jgi:hypothetical protein
MATTTFSGPIKAGTISNTTGTTLGNNVRNTGQVVMSQSIMIDTAIAAGATTFNVGVIPRNSQLLTATIRTSVVNNNGTSCTISMGKTGSAAYFLAAQNGQALAEYSTLATGSFDEADRFGSDVQITATVTTVGAVAGAPTGQTTVTFTYLQANNLRDATAA